MTPALLIYNPVAGPSQESRLQVVHQVASILRGHGYSVKVTATTHRSSAGGQVRQAVNDGAEVIFACGGDGTLHDVLQGIVGTQAALAPLPLGSANALCRELGIPLHPLKAAAAYGHVERRVVPAGDCTTTSGKRRFLLMAGAGPDGALMYRMLTTARGRLGRWAYAMHALRLLLRDRFEPFRVRFQDGSGEWRQTSAVSAMALRIGTLGGIFPGIARGASLDNPHLRLVLVLPPAPVSLPLWFLSSWLHLERWNPLLHAVEVRAFTVDGTMAHAQADGEWIGRVPLRVELTDVTVTLLAPVRHQRTT